jgi:hypothetical protein
MLIEDLYTQSFAHEKEEKLLLLSKKALRKQSPIKMSIKRQTKQKSQSKSIIKKTTNIKNYQ